MGKTTSTQQGVCTDLATMRRCKGIGKAGFVVRRTFEAASIANLAMSLAVRPPL